MIASFVLVKTTVPDPFIPCSEPFLVGFRRGLMCWSRWLNVDLSIRKHFLNSRSFRPSIQRKPNSRSRCTFGVRTRFFSLSTRRSSRRRDRSTRRFRLRAIIEKAPANITVLCPRLKSSGSSSPNVIIFTHKSHSRFTATLCQFVPILCQFAPKKH